MKFSLHMAQQFSNVDLINLSYDEIITRIGAQLGAIEDKTKWAEKYRGILVAKVISCEKHPDADKLSLCLIDDGGVDTEVERNHEGYIQVVCGASNVREGLTVVWIPPGATVPSTYNSDRFVLESRELRGKISNGMIASPKELDISDDHEGILEIDSDEVGRQVTPGEPIAELFGLNDFVLDLENKMFTHRPDCFGNLGVARELSGIFGLEFKSPEWYLQPSDMSKHNGSLTIDIKNEIPEIVPRFTVVTMSNVSVGSSPTWLQSYLKRVGIKPINTVVDITNYVMHLTGQPLHAFDYDKLQKNSHSSSLMPRMAIDGERIQLLGGKEITLSSDDMVIATDASAVALAGIMGGAATEVDQSTKNIVIECANFDMYTIRRTSMRHGLFTDAVTRFNKGQSPLQNDRIIAFAIDTIRSITGAEQASAVHDLVSFDLRADNLNKVITTAEFINSRLGSKLASEDIQQLLKNVEFTVKVEEDSLEIIAPFWRMDIAIAEDIVEEVGRLYGYDKLPAELPMRSIKPTSRNKLKMFKQSLRNKLSKAGANEVLTYSFVHGKLLEQVGVDPTTSAYHIRNAISPELQYYRPSLIPSLLSKVHSNIKAQAGSDENLFGLFEIGKAHVKNHLEDEESSLPKQMRRLSFIVAADNKSSKKLVDSPYYLAKKYVGLITNNQATFDILETNEYPITAPYLKERSAVITIGPDRQPIGVVGEFRDSVSRHLKLPEYIAGFEIDIDLLLEHISDNNYQQLSQFPSSTQDITFEISNDISWERLHNLLQAELAVAKAELGLGYLLDALDIFKNDNSDKKRISMRITFTHHKKTLKTQEINDVLDQLAKAVHDELQATRI
jgi:phenylalanyl-tRNA synthetase beta chain